MGASNFCYDNRCVVVTNEDFECGNVPKHNERRKDSLRCYESFNLDDSDFEFWDVILTYGYYEAACIDYVPKVDMYGSNMVESRMRYAWNYDSVRQLVSDFMEEFGVSEYRVRKVIGKLSEYCGNLQAFVENAMEKMNIYLSELERERVDAYLDKLMEDYGYEEYYATARFSNGETWYGKKTK